MKKFLFTIYLCYAILGLCSPIVTSIWPEISKEFAVSASFLGLAVTINYLASGFSSLVTFMVRKKLGTNYTNVFGLSFFVIGLIIFANLRNPIMIIIAMAILGLGNGFVDTNSNSYVVKAYDAKWVSLMHSCWGLASSVGPIIMSVAIVYTSSYRNGFKFVLAIIVITIILLLYLKQNWKKQREHIDKDVLALHSVTEEEKNSDIKMIDVLKMKGVLRMLFCFTFANGSSCAVYAWLATIMVATRGISVVEGATAVSIYLFSLTIGRIVMGFVADKIGIDKSVKFLAFVGTLFVYALFIPYKSLGLIYLNSAVLGFMSGPTIPLLTADLKNKFDKKILGELVSFAGVFGLLGVASLSALMTLASTVLSINYIHIIPAIGSTLLCILYSSLETNK